jgi:hypothetical protein
MEWRTMTATTIGGATRRPLHAGTTFSYMDVRQGVFPGLPCEVCAASPSVIRVCRWRCPGAGAGMCPEPMEGEAHAFGAAHRLLAAALARRPADA